MSMLIEGMRKYRMYLGYSFGDDGLTTSRFALGVICEPARLHMEEVHSEPSFKNTADMALPASFRADKEDEHALNARVQARFWACWAVLASPTVPIADLIIPIGLGPSHCTMVFLSRASPSTFTFRVEMAVARSMSPIHT